jgi:diguanylate cyclase (GGDEF)-like protein
MRRDIEPATTTSHPPRPSSAALHERPPRLVLRFALVTAACLGLGAAAILGFVRHTDTVQAERAAATRAQLAVDAVFAKALRARDLQPPLPESRRRDLRAAVQTLPAGDTLLVTASHRGRIFWASDEGRIGHREDAAVTGAARKSTLTSDVTSIADPAVRDDRVRVLRSVVPLSLEGARVAVVVYQDYAPIQRTAREAFLPVAGILELTLFALFVFLVPLLARVSRRIGRQIERIRYQAYHDDLTGLPNRLRFRDGVAEAVEEAGRGRMSFAALLVDLDRFKEVNDALGHDVGDELLVGLGERLRHALPENVLLARLGGDEFGLVVPDADESTALEVAEHLRASLAEPFELDGLPVAVEGSVGIVLCPDDGDDVDTLLRRADVAMYAAKERRLGVARYEPDFETTSAERLSLMAELGRALDEGELVLYVQPQASLSNGEIVGAEALVRWLHPMRGLIPPGEFVPFAERTGLGRRLSRFVLEQAVQQLAVWSSDADAPRRLAVNLSMVDLLDLGLPQEVARLLHEAGVESERLELEITEGVIMADPVRVGTVLEQLREVGVKLAIDDFGTGYSSLAYLKRLPVDILKIDRSFVSGMVEEPRDAAVVRSAIELAHSLGLDIVAEGVEDEQTFAALRGLGCDFAQGYYIARPVPVLELPHALAVWAGDAVAPRAAAVATS